MIESSFRERFWDKVYYWSVRLHRKVGWVAWLCYRFQRSMYYKWAEEYTKRIHEEWEQDDRESLHNLSCDDLLKGVVSHESRHESIRRATS